MNKSEKLDELRLKIGLVADRVNSRNTLYSGIINTIGHHTPSEFAVAIYLCNGSFFSRFYSFGKITDKNFLKYGESMFSLCAIRGKVTIHTEVDLLKIYAPFYDGHHLIGILLIECKDTNYEITEEDFIFLDEIIRFVEVKGKQYGNCSMDNSDW